FLHRFRMNRRRSPCARPSPRPPRPRQRRFPNTQQRTKRFQSPKIGIAMSLRLTPDMLAAAYDFLRTTEPFRRWSLPEADDVGFAVVRDPKMFADFGMENGIPVIRVSEAKNGHTVTL